MFLGYQFGRSYKWDKTLHSSWDFQKAWKVLCNYQYSSTIITIDIGTEVSFKNVLTQINLLYRADWSESPLLGYNMQPNLAERSLFKIWDLTAKGFSLSLFKIIGPCILRCQKLYKWRNWGFPLPSERHFIDKNLWLICCLSFAQFLLPKFVHKSIKLQRLFSMWKEFHW